MESRDGKLLFCFLFLWIIFNVAVCLKHDSVFRFEVDSIDNELSLPDSESLQRAKRKAEDDAMTTESESESEKCEQQKNKFADILEKLKNNEKLEETHEFTNESKYTLALAWAGENDKGNLLVLTTDARTTESTLWRSQDYARTWVNCSDQVSNENFRKDDGLQRNPHNPEKVYLITYGRYMYTTEDGGDHWSKQALIGAPKVTSLTVDEALEFHPDKDHENYVAVVSNDRNLYVSVNNFQSEPLGIKEKVHLVKWGTKASHTEKVIFAVTGSFNIPLPNRPPDLLTLERYDLASKTWKSLLQRVVLFDLEGKFMYATTYKSETPATREDEKLMLISNDGGETWREAELPTITGDRFYSVLDMSEDLIFMHVDNPGDSGHGTLYTSASRGIVYSESLTNHLFPNYNTVHDFYKVKSIRGVYLASQMSADKSIHTVITYDQGGEWLRVPRPSGSKCEDGESSDCSLQIHNAYSLHRGIKARMPHSLDKALGLVLVHANVAQNLQTTSSDVYLSTDGGYNFKRVLRGPHAYEIADSGGLIVAVPIDKPYPDTIKFSTDEGNCWHVYKFTSQKIRFTGLLTEPGGKSLTVSVWGYQVDTKKWTVSVINFAKVISRQCVDEDYIQWTPHIARTNSKGMEGCFLGQKETFLKIKPDKWCQNKYDRALYSVQQKCLCTKEDYECDFGYYRKDGSDECVLQPDFKSKDIDLCVGDRLEELVSLGYRLIPGDKCDTRQGFRPNSKLVDLKMICEEGRGKSVVREDMTPEKKPITKKLIFIVAVSAVLLVGVVLAGLFVYKLVILRRHKTVYRYSMLNQSQSQEDKDLENALINHDSLYKDSSDEEIEQENRSPQRSKSKHGLTTNIPAARSYHDDSDDDMLG